MPDTTPTLTLNQPDPALLERLGLAKQICLGVVALVAFLNLCARLVPGMGCALPGSWHWMMADSSLAAVLSALSLYLSEHSGFRQVRRLSLLLGLVVALLAAAIFVTARHRISFGLDALLSAGCGSLRETMSAQIAAAFALLGASTALLGARGRMAIRAGDLAVFALCLLVMILVFGYLFAALRIFGLPSPVPASPQTLFCLAFLALVTLLRRAEDGVFSIFLGRGIGSRIARALIPVLLVLPFVREAGRTHLLQARFIPVQYATAILASFATMVSLVLLLFLAWWINGMEMEIHDLSLRDALTGLHNLRGFSLLAEQALRLAYRSQLPFSVLYIDLDNLKQINDSMGHDTGSSFLAETGKLLKATFRETDVLGRIGGDEFAVAGHFSPAAIATAAERLRAASALKNAETDRRHPLSFSIGYATATEHARESLKDLLTAADAAMYEEKRSKKVETE
jgi:diguanylate cyclase (GGDEF)-like protein